MLPRPVLLALVLLLVLVLLTGCLRLLSRSMMYPGSPVPFPPEADLARRFPQARLVDYEATDGAPLKGALFQRPGSQAPLVVHFHGNGESAAQNLDFAEELFDRGLDVFLAEYRGFGGLPGRPTESNLYADGEGALKALQAAGIPPERIVLLGRSLGSGIATELAVRHPCRQLILVSPYTSMVDMGKLIAGPLANFAVADRYNNLAKIRRVCCPVVILHGTRDEVIPVRMGRKLAAAAGVELIEVPEASHNSFPGLEERVTGVVGAPGSIGRFRDRKP